MTTGQAVPVEDLDVLIPARILRSKVLRNRDQRQSVDSSKKERRALWDYR